MPSMPRTGGGAGFSRFTTPQPPAAAVAARMAAQVTTTRRRPPTSYRPPPSRSKPRPTFIQRTVAWAEFPPLIRRPPSPEPPLPPRLPMFEDGRYVPRSRRPMPVRPPKPPIFRPQVKRFQSQEQVDARGVIRRLEMKATNRLLYYRDPKFLTSQQDRPPLHPTDLPDALAARAEYIRRCRAPPDGQLLRQINAEISAMQGSMTRDQVHFLTYDHELQARPEYRSASRRFTDILHGIRAGHTSRVYQARQRANQAALRSLVRENQWP